MMLQRAQQAQLKVNGSFFEVSNIGPLGQLHGTKLIEGRLTTYAATSVWGDNSIIEIVSSGETPGFPPPKVTEFMQSVEPVAR